jgi:putative transposase
MDLRWRIVAAVTDGSSIRAAARRFAVSPSAAIKLMQRVQATGSPAPDRYGGHRQPILEPHRAEIERMVATEPRATLAELRERLRERHGVSVGLSTLHAALHRLGLRHKKTA